MKETLVICIEDIVSNSILELYKITGIPSKLYIKIGFM